MLFRVRFVVTAQRHGEEPVRHIRWFLVECEDIDAAEAAARPSATAFCFGQRVLAVEWRQTGTVLLPVDATRWAEELLAESKPRPRKRR